MKSFVSLELRKQRRSFVGLLFLIGVCLIGVTASLASFSDLNPGEAFLLITVVLQAFGLPLFALLLGSGAGAQLRSSERIAEEDIPVRPKKRIIAAYIASLTYLLCLSGFLFVLPVRAEYFPSLQQDFHVAFGFVLLIPLHSAAFACSYWLSQAVLGGAVSAMIIGIPAYIFYPFLLFGSGINFVVVLYNAIPGFTAAAIHLTMMLWLATRIEREKRIFLLLRIVFALVMMGALVVGIFGWFSVIPDLFDASRHQEFHEQSNLICCENP
jgi:hypothetical protein